MFNLQESISTLNDDALWLKKDQKNIFFILSLT
jgi:hypothetical protein